MRWLRGDLGDVAICDRCGHMLDLRACEPAVALAINTIIEATLSPARHYLVRRMQLWALGRLIRRVIEQNQPTPGMAAVYAFQAIGIDMYDAGDEEFRARVDEYIGRWRHR